MDHAPTSPRTPPGGPARQRARLSDAPLLRLLSRLGEPDVPVSAEPLTARLSRWLDWTNAIALSSLLSTPVPQVPMLGVTPAEVDAEARELARVRRLLSQTILDAPATAAATAAGTRSATDARRASLGLGLGTRPAAARAAAPAPETLPAAAQALAATLPDPDTDFPALRRRCIARQQAMETAITALRTRLRGKLSGATPDLARLAALDAAMEQVLAPQERSQLALLPRVLERRFERQRRAHPDGDTSWLPAFHHDMQQLLLAELELRMQPVEGLLEALRALPPSRP